MNTEEISYILLSFILISIFIGIFFYTYVSKVEEDIIKGQISNIIDNSLSSLNIFLSDKDKKDIGDNFIKNLSYPDMSKADNDAEKNNESLVRKSIILFSVLLGVGILLLLLLWFYRKYSILDILKYSFIILLLVGLTEFIFVSFVIRNYKLIDPNYVYYLLSKNLEKYKQE